MHGRRLRDALSAAWGRRLPDTFGGAQAARTHLLAAIALFSAASITAASAGKSQREVSFKLTKAEVVAVTVIAHHQRLHDSDVLLGHPDVVY